MTAPNGPILFNNSTGSNTLASGLGPSIAVNSTTEGSTASYSGTTITFSGATDLSGVSAGDLLYLVTSTGRQFFVIASVNDSTDSLTIDDAPAGTTSGLSWAIGGKRASLNGSVRLLDTGSTGDAKGGWILELGDGYTETLSARIVTRVGGDTTNGPITVRGEAGAAITPVLSLSANTEVFLINASYFCLQDIEFRNTNATKTASYVLRVNSGLNGIVVKGIVANHSTDNFWRAFGIGGNGIKIKDCILGNFEDVAIKQTLAGGGLDISECRIFSCGSHGIDASGFTNFGLNITNNLIYGNSGDGIVWGGGTDGRESGRISGNIIHNNGSNGIQITNTSVSLPLIAVNVVSSNGAYGIVSAADGFDDAMSQIVDRNAFYNNTSGEMSGVSVATNSITLTADPFIDAASGDFNINNDAGGGATLRAATVTL